MIELVGQPGTKEPKIRFKPRQGFKTTAPVLEYDLVYGHACAYCGNVIQACYLAKEPADLWLYEETTVMSLGKSDKTAGTILRVVPNAQSNPGTSNYRHVTLRNRSDPAQHLALANHVLLYHGIGQPPTTTDRHLEPNTERCCEYAGIFSLRADLIVRDICLFMGMLPAALDAYNLPALEEFLARPVVQQEGFRQVLALGTAPPVVLIPLEWVRGYGARAWQAEQLLKPWKKITKTSSVVVPF